MKNELELIDVLKTQEDVDHFRSSLVNSSRASRYYSHEDKSFLVLREISIDQDSIVFTSKSFIICGTQAYLYEELTDKLIVLNEGHHDIMKIATDAHAVSFEVLNSYYDQIDILEDCIYERDVPRHFMDAWFDLKKNILKIERYYNRYVLVFKNYITANSQGEGFDVNEANSVLEKAFVNLNQSSGLVSRLDTIHNYYSSIKNDRLNKNIYFLTLVSGIFLPLNLIVGFFGMNTENLFFKEQPEGTMYVVYILASVIFCLTIGLRIARFIDNTFLRHSLGKYKIYQTIFKRVEKIEKAFEFDSI